VPSLEGGNMKALKAIQKTREYLDYLEEHILNVKRAWLELQEKCSDMRFIYSDFFYHTIDSEVEHHDISKLSEHEFVQYRKWFFPVEEREKDRIAFDKAWKHHKENNLHHWETWTQKQYWDPNEWERHCVHMVIDWMAMGYKFGDTAQEYYERNKDKINLPRYAVDFIYEIFSKLGNVIFRGK
jgi:hypothetical protein